MHACVLAYYCIVKYVMEQMLTFNEVVVCICNSNFFTTAVRIFQTSFKSYAHFR